MKNKTAEQILEEIEIHKKTGATARIKLLESRLKALSSPEEVDTQEEVEEVPAGAIDETESNLGGPSFDELNEEGQILRLLELKESGKSWAEVTEETGVKAPWMKIKAYQKKN